MGIFLKNINQFIAETHVKEHKVVKEIMEEIISATVERSPVDTGNFVTNWLIGLDDAVPFGVTGTKNPDRSFTVNKLYARIPENAADHNYNLVNNTKYGKYLEEGHSKDHAPYGIVGMVRLKIPFIVRDVVLRNK